MHVLGCIVACTATGIFCSWQCTQLCRGHGRGHCLPINAPTYYNVTCHTTDALPQSWQWQCIRSVAVALQCIHIACNGWQAVTAIAFLSVCLSICLSVRFRCFVQTNEATIMRFSLSGSTIFLVSEEVKIIWKFTGDTPARELKWGHRLLQAKIWLIMSHNLKTVQDRM